MNTDAKFLELPLKYAFLAALIFAISSFLLGYFYQFLALSALDMSIAGLHWDEIKDIGGFSLNRIVRYFIFYFLIFISLTCFMRSPAKSSSWSPVILLAAIPTAAGFIPFLLSTGEFISSSHWSLAAMLIGLMFLGISPWNGTKFQRFFSVGLATVIILYSQMNDIATWEYQMHNAFLKIHGEDLAASKTDLSLLYFAPTAIIRLAVDVFMIFVIPLKFIKESNEAET